MVVGGCSGQQVTATSHCQGTTEAPSKHFNDQAGRNQSGVSAGDMFLNKWCLPKGQALAYSKTKLARNWQPSCSACHRWRNGGVRSDRRSHVRRTLQVLLARGYKTMVPRWYPKKKNLFNAHESPLHLLPPSSRVWQSGGVCVEDSQLLQKKCNFQVANSD